MLYEVIQDWYSQNVFGVCLRLKCEGNAYQIEEVYGAKEQNKERIMKCGEIKKIGTLFASKRSKAKGGTKGGIQLIKLKRNNKAKDNMNVELVVTFETVDGNKYCNTQLVNFTPPNVMNDMIECDDFYDNIGIRKGILLCRYVELIRAWIKSEQSEQNFLKYFRKEMKECKDDELEKEVVILQKLSTNEFVKRSRTRYSYQYYKYPSSSDDSSSD